MLISQILQNKSKFYLNHSIDINQKQETFVNNISILNHTTGEIKNMKYDYKQIEKDNYLWLTFTSQYLQDLMAKQGDMVAFFITTTLPTEYHPYHTFSAKGKKLKTIKHNKNYDVDLTIKMGADKLNNHFRSLVKDYKVNGKYVRIYYNRVLEPHKSMVAHLHGITYIHKSEVENFKKYFWSKHSDHGLGRTELEEIKDIKRSSAYLLKYIAKSMSPEMSKSNLGSMYHGWRTHNKIRSFTYSQCSIPRYIFKKVSNAIRPDLHTNYNYLSLIESLIDIQIDIIEESRFGIDCISSKQMSNSTSEYEVLIVKKKVIQEEGLNDFSFLLEEYPQLAFNEYLKKNDLSKVDFYDKMSKWEQNLDGLEWWDFCFGNEINGKWVYDYIEPMERNDGIHFLEEYAFCCQTDIQIKTYSYPIKTFLIKSKKTGKIIYDKNDFEIFSMFAEKNV